MPKTRLDLLLVERGLAESRSLAQRLIMAGQVRVDGQLVLKPATGVASEVELALDYGPRYVSRGGEKLQGALEAFPLTVQDRTCADVGASTGGFTDCLLQHGAARVYAIDVGKGLLHWKLRNHPRVVVMEKTNARYVACLPEPVTLVTVDASFISLKILLPVIKNWFAPAAPDKAGTPGDVIALIKPQFEAGRKQSAKGKGVIRDAEVHRQTLLEVLGFARSQGFALRGLIRSPLLGPKGNTEFLAWLASGGEGEDPAMLVEALLPEQHAEIIP
jgi:23S rRNA (cytidine1920-2'-O)/16S rRNA (cytidine1409-2'-O)-methyltransferase